MNEPASPRQEKINDLMERASEALSRTAYFEAERMACKALYMAREERDFDLMARIVLPLQEARRQRLQLAIDVGKATIFDEPVNDETRIKPGCYIVGPPQVGADARKLKVIGMQTDTPVAVLCCEPITRLGLLPIVAIAPGVTVRTKIRPPAKPHKPDMAWFVEALDTLGESAIASIDPGMDPDRRVEALLMRLDAVPEHEQLHQALLETCREAVHRASGTHEPEKADAKP